MSRLLHIQNHLIVCRVAGIQQACQKRRSNALQCYYDLGLKVNQYFRRHAAFAISLPTNNKCICCSLSLLLRVHVLLANYNYHSPASNIYISPQTNIIAYDTVYQPLWSCACAWSEMCVEICTLSFQHQNGSIPTFAGKLVHIRFSPFFVRMHLW